MEEGAVGEDLQADAAAECGAQLGFCPKTHEFLTWAKTELDIQLTELPKRP